MSISDAFTPGQGLVGGALIGASVWVLLFGLGRVAGVSGILGMALRPSTPGAERPWRLAFLVGLVLGPVVVGAMWGRALIQPSPTSWILLIVAGAIVGLGTGLANGCTSGHGVCGVARLSPRSLAATGVFMAAGFLTATVFRHLLGF